MNGKNNTSKYIGVTVLLILANVVIGVVTNLASDRMPIWFEFYSWPLLIFVTLLLIIFTLYQLRNSTITTDINNQTPLSQTQHSVDNVIDNAAYPTWHMEVDMEHFYGREQELAILKQWTIVDCCRVIALVGLGGIGKTTLVAHLVDQVCDQFDQVIWRSMRNAPPLTDLLTEYFQVLSQYHSGILPEKLEDRLRLLVQILSEQPILIILDNFESILEREKRAGEYRTGYMDFGLLLDHLAKAQHQSTFLITSREKPREVALHEGENTPVRSLQLSGLDRKSSRQLLHDKGLIGTNAEQVNLVEHYQGNPLALKIVGSMVRDSFAGRIDSFLSLSTKMVNDINIILNEQLSRLFPLERSILYWLAIARESLTIEMISYYLMVEFSQSDLVEALTSLQRRSLIEISQGRTTYTLQNVVMEFVTEQVVKRLTQEIISGDIHLFSSHSILIAQAKEYLRHSQLRLITRPLSEQLLQKVGKVGLANRLDALLDSLRDKANGQQGYAVGNFMNLLIQLGFPLNNFDFSNLTIRQAYLQDTILRDVNFVNANFVDCVFHQAFGGALSIAFSADGRLIAVGNTVGEIHIWEVTNFRRMNTLDGHTGWVFSLAFSPDNNLLASGNNDHTIRLWDGATGQCIKVFEGHTNRVYGIDFSADGYYIVSASNDHSIRIWDVRTGQCLHSLERHIGRVYTAAFSSDGKLVASGGEDKNILLWSLATGQLLSILYGHTRCIRRVLFSSSDEILASAGEDNTIRLWEVSTGVCIHELKGHTNYVLSQYRKSRYEYS